MGVIYCQQVKVEEDFINQLSDCFSIGDERYAYNDYKFSLQKIIEISLRAVSPGINDPYTAIRCTGKLLGTIDKSTRGTSGRIY